MTTIYFSCSYDIPDFDDSSTVILIFTLVRLFKKSAYYSKVSVHRVSYIVCASSIFSKFCQQNIKSNNRRSQSLNIFIAFILFIGLYLFQVKSHNVPMKRKRQTTPTLRMPPVLRYRRGVGKVISKSHQLCSTMASKPRMRQWLEDLLDNNKCKGLTWVNREEKKFEITWHHASRQDFDTKEHADLFVQYAKFTGKTELVEETKKNYNSKLKSNFRSALHSLVDCVKVKDMTTGRSKGENAVRCYMFLDPSDPECKRRRTEKINSQRNSKKNGAAKSKCKMESEVKEETSVDYPFDEDNIIFFPDEANEFFNNSNIQDEQNTSSIVCDDLVTLPMIDDITTPISYQATPTTSCQALPPLPTSSSPEPSTSNTHSSGGADRNVFVVPGNGVVEIDLSALKGDNIATSSLPKFRILGVEDTFDNPINHASQMLTSGGSMRVRKEPKPKIPQQTFTELRNVELPQNQRSDIIEPGYAYGNTLETDPLLTVNVSNVMEQGSLTQNVHNIEESSFYTMSDGNGGFNLGFGRIIQQNESVTAVLQDPQTVSQGENYDLLPDVGQF